MNETPLSRFSGQYLAALRIHVDQGPAEPLQTACELGDLAVALGLETLEMARIHDAAVMALLPATSPDDKDGVMGRTGMFFAEAITAIEKTHRGAMDADAHLGEIVKTLSQRTLQLAESVAELKLEISQRRTVEDLLRVSEQTTTQLLEELRQLSRQLLSAQEEERRKISRELHDVIAQTLTGINLRLATLKAAATTSNKALWDNISATQRLVVESVEIVHQFARELRPTVLDDLGLIPALESFMKGFTAETGIRVTLTAFAGIEQVDNTRRTALYRVTQEALTNAARHSGASRADVSIQRLDGKIHMEIRDDGSGFAVEGQPGAKHHNRLGLLGMRERIEMIGGTFSVESAPGRPTTLCVKLPAETISNL